MEENAAIYIYGDSGCPVEIYHIKFYRFCQLQVAGDVNSSPKCYMEEDTS